MDDIRELIRDFVLDNFIIDVENEPFTDDMDLKEAGVLDSLAVLKLISFVEGQFHVELRAEDIETNNIFSVSNIEKLVRTRRS